jgi:putative NADH-flavin reductase
MTTFIIGASGATGKHLVEQLLGTGQNVKVMVRDSSNYPEHWNKNTSVTIIKSNINEVTAEEMSVLIKDCQAIACCLGHNVTLKGIYGKPRKLV